MSEGLYDFSEKQIRDLVSGMNFTPVEVETIIKYYSDHRMRETQGLSTPGVDVFALGSEEKMAYARAFADKAVTIRDGRDILAEIADRINNFKALEKSLRDKGAISGSKVLPHDEILKKRKTFDSLTDLEHGYLRYLRDKQEMLELYLKCKDWGEVFSTLVYQDDTEASEAFIDTIEETLQIKVKDVIHLSEITGITNLFNYWDKAKGFLEDEEAEALAKEEKKPLKSYKATEKQTREEALRQLEETLTGARYSRYYRALTIAIENGAKYKDLLQIKPQDFDLPETWEKGFTKDQYSSILVSIAFTFGLNEPNLSLLPSLRDVAQELEAPYSVIMDAHKYFSLERRLDHKEDKVIEKLKKAVRKYVASQPKDWREDRSFNPKGKSWTEEDAKRTEEGYINFYPIWFKILLYHELNPEEKLNETQIAIINAHKETIYKHFKSYLDEAKEIYQNMEDELRFKALKSSIANIYLP